jgi:hypothetical protein
MAYSTGPRPKTGKSFAVWTDNLIQCYDGFNGINNSAWPDDATTYVTTGSAARNGNPQLEGTGSSEAHYINFDGTGDYFLFEQYAQGYTTTLSVWYKTNSVGDGQSLCSHISGGPVSTYYWIGTNQKMYFGYYDGQWRQVGGGGTSVCDNTWHQLVWARNGTEHKMYVDGSLDQTTTMNSSMAGTINVIGAKWGGGYPLNGHLAHFSMYNAQLSAHQISTMFAGQRRRFGV